MKIVLLDIPEKFAAVHKIERLVTSDAQQHVIQLVPKYKLDAPVPGPGPLPKSSIAVISFALYRYDDRIDVQPYSTADLQAVFAWEEQHRDITPEEILWFPKFGMIQQQQYQEDSQAFLKEWGHTVAPELLPALWKEPP